MIKVEMKRTTMGMKMFVNGNCVCHRCQQSLDVEHKTKWCDPCYQAVIKELQEARQKGASIQVLEKQFGIPYKVVKTLVDIVVQEKKERAEPVRRLDLDPEAKTWYEWATDNIKKKQPNSLDFLKSKIKR